MSNFLVVYNDKTTEIILFIQTLVTTTTNILFIIFAILFFMIEEQEMNRITALNQQLDNANAQLKEANIKLKDYSRTVENMSKAQERNRLAKEIHDTLGHALTNIVAGIDASLILIEDSVPETKEQLSLTRDIASHGIIDIRRSVKALRPDALEQASTRIAINNMLNKIQSTTKVKIINKNELSESSFDRDEEEAIYRTVQESITNAIRHGGASTIRVSIKEESNIVHIKIQDNGCGCESIKEGFGLLHMKERISMLNGKIEYSGTNGFLVDAYIPLRKREI
jgi:signal transduction histidine kinase